MQGRIVLDDMAARDRLAFWRDVVCTHLYNVTPDEWPDPATFHGSWEVRDCGQFGLADVVSANRQRLRGAADIARDGVDVITVQRAMGGTMAFDFAADRFVLQPGDLCVFAMDWRHEATAAEGVALRSLEIPRAVLSPLLAGGNLRRPLLLPGGSPVGALLAAGLEAAWTQVPLLPPAIGDAVLRNLSGLVALAHGASDEGEERGRAGVLAVRRDAAVAYVTRHLAEPDLSPAQVAVALGVSVRTLHKLFETGGESFSQLVTRLRLEACLAALQAPAGARRSVADIAFGWGFNSLPTFYRAFAANFGVAPGAVRPAQDAPLR